LGRCSLGHGHARATREQESGHQPQYTLIRVRYHHGLRALLAAL